MAVDLPQLDLAEGHEPIEEINAASSVLKEAWVFVRRRNSRLRFSSVLVVRSDFHIAFGKS
jgi:hypothetical protein